MRETAKCWHSYGDVTHTYIQAIVDENTCRSKRTVSQHSSVCYIPYKRMDRYYALCWLVCVCVFCCCHYDENRLCLVFTETCTYMFPWLSRSIHFLYISIEFSLWCSYCWFLDAFLLIICFFSLTFEMCNVFFLFGFILLSNSTEKTFARNDATWLFGHVYDLCMNDELKAFILELIRKRETDSRLHVRSCCRWVKIIHKMTQWFHKRHRTDKVNWIFKCFFCRLNFVHTQQRIFLVDEMGKGE